MELVEGWKGMLRAFNAIGITMAERTLKRWHYERNPIKFQKTYPSPRGRIIIDKKKLYDWYQETLNMPMKTRERPLESISLLND